MAFTTPTLKEIIDRMDSDAEGRLPGVQPRLRRSLLGAVIRAVAGAVYSLYSLLITIPERFMPDTATGDELDRWAAIRLSVIRKQATNATGNITFTGTDTTDIPAGTVVQRADGVEFSVDATVTISGGTALAAVTAVLAGADSNTAAGVTLTLTSPIAGVDSDAVIDGNAITGGADLESDESLRERLLNNFSSPPQGGNANDYITWAREVAGVSRAWSYPLEGGLGNVAVRFMMDDIYADGIPLAADVTAVNDYIDVLMPAGTILTVVAPTAVPLDFTIHVSPDTTETRAAVEAELKDLILRDSQPNGDILLSRINEAISLAEGEIDHTVTVPAGNVSHLLNEIATMGTITWN